MDEASVMALEKAMELAERQQGQPWGAEAIVGHAQTLRAFLEDEPMTEPLHDRIAALEDRLSNLSTLEDQMREVTEHLRRYAPAPKPTPRKRASEPTTTGTTPPDVPEPVDF